jgi:hypothetical protein
VAFFSFQPASDTTPFNNIVLFAPDRGYQMECLRADDGVTLLPQIGLPGVRDCEDGIDKPVTHYLDNTTLVGGELYTFAVMLVNAYQPVEEADNLFGLLINDQAGVVSNANMVIQGQTLVEFPAEVTGFAWSDAKADEVSALRISLEVTQEISAGAVGVVVIQAPEGMLFDNPEALTMHPNQLPIIPYKPIVVTGTRLTIHIDSTERILTGRYDLTFSVRNPTQLDRANVWHFKLMKDSKTENLVQYINGYVFGQLSPAVLAPPSDQEGFSKQHDVWTAFGLTVLGMAMINW